MIRTRAKFSPETIRKDNEQQSKGRGEKSHLNILYLAKEYVQNEGEIKTILVS